MKEQFILKIGIGRQGGLSIGLLALNSELTTPVDRRESKVNVSIKKNEGETIGAIN